MSKLHYHQSLPRYPNNFVNVRRMDGSGKIHHLTERINPHGEIEVLRQHNNRYVPVHTHGGRHTHHGKEIIHATGISKHPVDSKELLKKIYTGFGNANKKGTRKLE